MPARGEMKTHANASQLGPVTLRIVGCSNDPKAPGKVFVSAEDLSGSPAKNMKFKDEKLGEIWILTGVSFGVGEFLGLWFSPLNKFQELYSGAILTEIQDDHND